MLEINGFRDRLKKNFIGTEKTWNRFLKPALNTASPYIGMAVSAKTKNPKIEEGPSNILNSIPGGKVLSLTGMHGNGLRMNVKSFYFKRSFMSK